MGQGKGDKFDIFTRFTLTDVFRVTVIGPDPSTKWYYRIRCHPPQSNLFGDQEEEPTGFEWSDAGNPE